MPRRRKDAADDQPRIIERAGSEKIQVNERKRKRRLA